MLGYIGQWHSVKGCPTLAAYLKNRTGIHKGHPCIVFLTDHCVAISGELFCDLTNNGVMIDIDRAPGRRKLVNHVFVVTGRIFAAHIPSKPSSRVPTTHATAEDKRRLKEQDRLFREAIKAETGATRVMITSSGDVHTRTPSDSHWEWVGEISNVQRSLLEPRTGGYLCGDTPEATAYRTAMGF
ncbi:hypothetical protein OE766_24310 [Pararhizobium sp. YC-54]|uniref:hypothetical protein n=1 Tax=Pararhizobium sp. YC-54 TaxID=2986920 RepID=UPI0021F6EDB7|nr:hypothetical protein [Pararhizobium sp. YC-54]MCW0001349.1 hypothetical protein [Pararhizobium sp. YC-54]